MILLVVFLSAALLVAVASPIAWVILSRWLGGRSLIIATVASAVSLGIGSQSYAGPLDSAVLVALAGLSGSVLAGTVIAKIWLARAAMDDGLIDG